MQKIILKKLLSKFFIGSFFVFAFLFLANNAKAFSALVPDDPINFPVTSCGEISAAGTYTLDPSFDANTLDPNGNCFVVDAQQIGGGIVTINGNNQTVAGTGGSFAVEARAYNTAGDTSSGLIDGGSPSATAIVIQNITFTGFNGGGVNASGNPGDSNTQKGGNSGSISIYTSTIGSIVADGGIGFGMEDGGTGGTISITNSIVESVSSNGGGADPNYEGNGGNSGSILITSNSAVGGSINSNGGNAGGLALNPGWNNSGMNGGNGNSIIIASSTVGGNIMSTGGTGMNGAGWDGYGGGNGGNGGSVAISGVNINLLNKTVDIAGGAPGSDGQGNYGSYGTNGTLYITYSGTLTRTDTTLSALSDLAISSDGGSHFKHYGAFPGGHLLLPEDNIIDASQCASLYFSGTYNIQGSLPAGDCHINHNGINLDGGRHWDN